MFLEGRSLWDNGLIFGRFYPDFSQQEWRSWLENCKLSPAEGLGALSKGERMKFQFAFAMAHQPSHRIWSVWQTRWHSGTSKQ